MTSMQHRLTALALVLIAAAILAPSASARPIGQVGPAASPASSPTQAPSSTAPTLPHGVAYSSTQPSTPSTPSQVRVVPVAPNPGFDWGDAGIGAGAAFALTMIGLGSVLVLTNRRHREERPATTA